MFRGFYIDDNFDKLEYLVELLCEEAQINTFSDVRVALQDLQTNTYDFIVVDINMPIMNGIEFIQEIHKQDLAHNAPIFILSSIQDDETKIQGLSLDVTDYLSFDMSHEELKLRILNKLKKQRNMNPGYFQGAVLNHDNYSLEYKNKSVTLTPLEYRIFHCLFAHEGTIDTYENLESKIWTNSSVARPTVNTHISNLNKKIKPLGIKIRRTVEVGIQFSFISNDDTYQE